jgi:large exoprotein involved in heme utilization and adhesion
VIQSNTVGDVDGAPIIIEATANADFIGTVIGTVTSGLGRGGDIQISGHDVIFNGSVIGTKTEFGGGAGGDVSVTASDGSVTLSSSTLNTQTTFSGGGGSINISTASLTIANGSALLSEVPGGDGPGGNIIVDATDLSISGGSTIGSSTFGSTSAQGGDIALTVEGSALISGSGTSVISTSTGDGPPGDISASFKTLTLTDGAVIQAGAFFGTEGGNSVTVTATDSILISNGAGISTQASFGEVGPLTISVPTGSLTVDNGFIATSTVGPGTAGDITANIGSLTLTHGGQIISSSIDVSGGSAEVGIGGNITINADSISISGKSPTGASVLPPPFSDFFADPHSGVFSTANGTGAAGNISMNTGQLIIADGGTISTESSGTAAGISAGLPGDSGNIDLVVETLRMDGGTITTAAAEAAGGDITITHTGSLLHLTDSQITTSVNGGLGGGGNITIGAELDSSGNVFNINPFDFIVLNNSGIHANAFGGPGGNINIFTDILLSSLPLATAITASSALNTPGTIDIQATVTEFSSDISQLPDVPLQATELLRATCAARVAGGRSSSLVLAGRGGLPLEPGGLLPSPLYLGADSAISFDNQNQPGERPKFSPSNFSILSDNQRSPRMGWNQFQLAKTTLGLDCSR